MYLSTVRLLAKFPIMSSWTLRKLKGLPLNYSNNNLEYTENIAYMMFARPNQDYNQNDIIVNAPINATLKLLKAAYRIPLTLSTWVPVIVIGIFSSIGILQINEK